MADNIQEKKNVSLKKIHTDKCSYPTCNLSADFYLLSAENKTVYSCNKHLKYFSHLYNIQIQKEREYSPIRLQNGINKYEECLFRSKSWIEPPNGAQFSWQNYKDFGKDPAEKKRKRIAEKESILIMEWEIWNYSSDEDKMLFSWGGQSNLILVNYQEKFYVFWQSGKIIAEVSGDYKPIQWFRY